MERKSQAHPLVHPLSFSLSGCPWKHGPFFAALDPGLMDDAKRTKKRKNESTLPKLYFKVERISKVKEG